ncbi:hypothetical protein [Thermostaphylospora chromogena]|uniref:hypothetical protein n=1 Tax=Thermostaphylospora chromogena TaxID=35622 RepID=UPI001F60F21D|nr:hypothetical protein [Thermostaphylospora chromogena]
MRSPARSSPATRWTAEGPPITRGEPRARRTPASSSPSSAGASLPRTDSRWLGRSGFQAAPEPSTSTGARTVNAPSAVSIRSTVAVTTTLSRRKTPSLAGSTRGSPVRTISTVTDAFPAAASATGPVPTAWTLNATAAAVAAAHPRAPATTPAHPRSAPLVPSETGTRLRPGTAACRSVSCSRPRGACRRRSSPARRLHGGRRVAAPRPAAGSVGRRPQTTRTAATAVTVAVTAPAVAEQPSSISAVAHAASAGMIRR